MLKVLRTLNLARPLLANSASVLASNAKLNQIQISNFHATPSKLSGADADYIVIFY